MQGKRRRGFALAVILAGACFGAAVWIASLRSTTAWFSDPNAPRASAELDAALEAFKGGKPAEPLDLGALTISTNEDGLRIEMEEPQAPSESRDLFRFTRHHADENQRVDVDGRMFSLDRIEIAYGRASSAALDQGSAPLTAIAFGANLEPIPENELREPQTGKRELRFHGAFPEVRFTVRFEGAEEVLLLSSALYDARTRQRISAGYSSWQSDGALATEFTAQIWHPAPVALVMDVAEGPMEIEEGPAERGTAFSVGEALLQLVAIAEGKDSGWSSSSSTKSGPSGQWIAETQFDLRLKPAPEVALLWVATPRAHPLPARLHAVGRNGEVLRSGGGGSSGRFKIQSVRANAADIKRVRVERFSRVRRLYFHLPELPGLPEVNRGAKNLFDVQAPFIYAGNSWELNATIERMTQMRFHGIVSPSGGGGNFPLTRTNATPSELLDWRLRQLGATRGGGQYVARVDAEAHAIVIEPPFLEQMKNRFKSFVQRVLR